MFNSIPAPGGGSGGPTVDETARAAATAASARYSPPLLPGQLLAPHGIEAADLLDFAGAPGGGAGFSRYGVMLSPVYIPGGTAIRRALAWLSCFGTFNFRVALYDTGSNGLPADRVWRSDELTFTAANGFYHLVEVEISPELTLDAGWYWLTVLGDSTDDAYLGTYDPISSGESGGAVMSNTAFFGEDMTPRVTSVLWCETGWFFDGEYWQQTDWTYPSTVSPDILPATMAGTWLEDMPDYVAGNPEANYTVATIMSGPIAAFLGT